MNLEQFGSAMSSRCIVLGPSFLGLGLVFGLKSGFSGFNSFMGTKQY